MKETRQINKHYNIMTSCDDNLTRYVSIQLYSIADNLKDSTIDFYLFHRGLKSQDLDMLDNLCKYWDNISFHPVVVPEPEKYDAIARLGGGWAGEAYFPLCAHQLLPDSVERILYIDAGDIMIIDDISPYYNCDFDDKALIVTATTYKDKNNKFVPYEEEDLYDKGEGFSRICRGLFNSGSYIINLDKLRNAQLTTDDFLEFSQFLQGLSENDDGSQIYFGDQGFLSAAFLGDIKFYNYEQVQIIWYMPYNFCLWFYDNTDKHPPYSVFIIHFVPNIKPWKMSYPIKLERFADPKEAHSFRELKKGQAEWYYMWQEYAISTDKILTELGY